MIKYYTNITLFLFFAMTLLISSSGFSQNIHGLNNHLAANRFTTDYAYFKADAHDLVRLEIYYRVYNTSLQFVGKGNRYEAGYEIAVLIRDNKNRQVTAFTKEKNISLYSYENTVAPRDYRIGQLVKELPPGKYKVELILTDKHSGAQVNSGFKVELPEFKGGYPMFSGIEFVEIVDTSIIDSAFRKGDIAIVPSVSRSFTADTNLGILYYFEIYKGDKSDNEYLIETRALNGKMSQIYSDTVRIVFKEDEKILRQVRRISMNEFKSGDYFIELVVKGKRNRDINRLREGFQLYWPPEQMILHDHETAINMLKYVADPGDTKKLKKAKTPAERLRLFKEFWKSKDPTPETRANELKQDYYRRIEYANSAFSIMRRDGWMTDFGMIYIQHGIPDQVEDFPFETNSRSHQIWYYYRYGQPLQFLFIDDFGDGDYRLQFPYDGKKW